MIRNKRFGLALRAWCLVAALLACPLLPACHPAPRADAVLLGRVFDARTGTVIGQGAVVVAGGRIRCAGKKADCRWSADTPVRDHGDRLLLPGLIDLHVHARPYYIGAFVPSGVTTVRDANNTLDTVAQLRAQPGAPRIVATGPLLDGERSVLATEPSLLGSAPLETLMPVTVRDEAEARAAVEALAVAGVDWIKLYEQLPPEAFVAAVQAARGLGIPVMADLGVALTRGLDTAQVDAMQAADAGISTLEHLGGLALAYRRMGGDPFAETLDEELLDALTDRLAATGVSVVPTAANAFQFARPGALTTDGLPGADRLVPFFQGHWQQLAGILGSESVKRRSATDLRLLQATLPRLLARNVRIGAGSDLPAAPWMLPGAALHQELQALVGLGMTPAQALKAATSDAADILGRPDLGRLEAGARADIVVVEGDPLADITRTRNVVEVWFDGRPVALVEAWDAVGAAMAQAGGGN